MCHKTSCSETIRKRKFTDRKQFLLFSVYAWGVPLFLLILTHILDASSIPYEWKPGVGTETCFLKGNKTMLEYHLIFNASGLSIFILFFFLVSTISSFFVFWNLPLIIIFGGNIMFFILTALKIFRVKQEINVSIPQNEVNQTKEK